MRISQFSGEQGLLPWIIQKLIDTLPAVIVTKALDAIDSLTDPRTPAVKRAILVTALLELLGLVKMSRPLAIILRFTIIQSAFIAGERYSPPPAALPVASTGSPPVSAPVQ